MLPSLAPLLGNLRLTLLAYDGILGCLLALARSEPVSGFFKVTVDSALFQSASGDGHQILCKLDLGKLGWRTRMLLKSRRHIPCPWSALGRQRARNRRQTIAFETLHF
jgi:hypothetical protein